MADALLHTQDVSSGATPTASPTPILDAARAELQGQIAQGTHLTGGLVADGQSLGVEVVGTKTWASGWFAGGMVAAAKRQGWRAAALFGYTPGEQK